MDGHGDIGLHCNPPLAAAAQLSSQRLDGWAARPQQKEVFGLATTQSDISQGHTFYDKFDTIKAAETQVLAAGTAHSLPEIQMKPPDFKFDTRKIRIDWRVLGGVDVDTVIKGTDLELLERVINIITYGDIQAEDTRMLTETNFVHVFQLAQLIIQYLLFVQDYLGEQNGQLLSNMRMRELQAAATQKRIREQALQVKQAQRELRRARKTVKTYEILATGGLRPAGSTAEGEPVDMVLIGDGSTQAQLHVNKETLVALHVEKQHLLADKERLEREQDKLQRQLEGLQADISDVQEEAEKTRQLGQRYSEMQELLGQAEQARKELGGEVRRLQQLQHESNTAFRRLSADADGARVTVVVQQRQMERLRSEVQRLREHNDEPPMDFERVQRDTQELVQQQLDRRTAEVSRLQREGDHWRTRYREAARVIEGIQTGSLDTLPGTAQPAQAAAGKTAEPGAPSAGGWQEVLATQVQSLRVQLQDERRNAVSAHERVQVQEAELVDLRGELEVVKLQLARKQTVHEDLLRRLKQARERAAGDSEGGGDALKRATAELEAQLEAASSQLEQAQKEVVRARARIVELEAEVRELRGGGGGGGGAAAGGAAGLERAAPSDLYDTALGGGRSAGVRGKDADEIGDEQAQAELQKLRLQCMELEQKLQSQRDWNHRLQQELAAAAGPGGGYEGGREIGPRDWKMEEIERLQQEGGEKAVRIRELEETREQLQQQNQQLLSQTQRQQQQQQQQEQQQPYGSVVQLPPAWQQGPGLQEQLVSGFDDSQGPWSMHAVDVGTRTAAALQDDTGRGSASRQASLLSVTGLIEDEDAQLKCKPADSSEQAAHSAAHCSSGKGPGRTRTVSYAASAGTGIQAESSGEWQPEERMVTPGDEYMSRKVPEPFCSEPSLAQKRKPEQSVHAVDVSRGGPEAATAQLEVQAQQLPADQPLLQQPLEPLLPAAVAALQAHFPYHVVDEPHVLSSKPSIHSQELELRRQQVVRQGLLRQQVAERLQALGVDARADGLSDEQLQAALAALQAQTDRTLASWSSERAALYRQLHHALRHHLLTLPALSHTSQSPAAATAPASPPPTLPRSSATAPAHGSSAPTAARLPAPQPRPRPERAAASAALRDFDDEFDDTGTDLDDTRTEDGAPADLPAGSSAAGLEDAGAPAQASAQHAAASTAAARPLAPQPPGSKVDDLPQPATASGAPASRAGGAALQGEGSEDDGDDLSDDLQPELPDASGSSPTPAAGGSTAAPAPAPERAQSSGWTRSTSIFDTARRPQAAEDELSDFEEL